MTIYHIIIDEDRREETGRLKILKLAKEKKSKMKTKPTAGDIIPKSTLEKMAKQWKRTRKR